MSQTIASLSLRPLGERPLSLREQPSSALQFQAPTRRLGTLSTGAIEELTRLEKLETDWDGCGARKIQRRVIENSTMLLRVLEAVPSLPVADVTPNPAGTITLEWESEQGYAALEVGLTRIGFYAKPNGGLATRFDGEVGCLVAATVEELGYAVASAIGLRATAQQFSSVKFAVTGIQSTLPA
ncbi:hypothetical protein [Ideonella sp.]|uniref:hypothetical protein n=1 Tax=Ideonella sp. TaxID=1929293 RepID=UPI0035B376BE